MSGSRVDSSDATEAAASSRASPGQAALSASSGVGRLDASAPSAAPSRPSSAALRATLPSSPPTMNRSLITSAASSVPPSTSSDDDAAEESPIAAASLPTHRRRSGDSRRRSSAREERLAPPEELVLAAVPVESASRPEATPTGAVEKPPAASFLTDANLVAGDEPDDPSCVSDAVIDALSSTAARLDAADGDSRGSTLTADERAKLESDAAALSAELALAEVAAALRRTEQEQLLAASEAAHEEEERDYEEWQAAQDRIGTEQANTPRAIARLEYNRSEHERRMIKFAALAAQARVAAEAAAAEERAIQASRSYVRLKLFRFHERLREVLPLTEAELLDALNTDIETASDLEEDEMRQRPMPDEPTKSHRASASGSLATTARSATDGTSLADLLALLPPPRPPGPSEPVIRARPKKKFFSPAIIELRQQLISAPPILAAMKRLWDISRPAPSGMRKDQFVLIHTLIWRALTRSPPARPIPPITAGPSYHQHPCIRLASLDWSRRCSVLDDATAASLPGSRPRIGDDLFAVTQRDFFAFLIETIDAATATCDPNDFVDLLDQVVERISVPANDATKATKLDAATFNARRLLIHSEVRCVLFSHETVPVPAFLVPGANAQLDTREVAMLKATRAATIARRAIPRRKSLPMPDVDPAVAAAAVARSYDFLSAVRSTDLSAADLTMRERLYFTRLRSPDGHLLAAFFIFRPFIPDPRDRKMFLALKWSLLSLRLCEYQELSYKRAKLGIGPNGTIIGGVQSLFNGGIAGQNPTSTLSKPLALRSTDPFLLARIRNQSSMVQSSGAKTVDFLTSIADLHINHLNRHWTDVYTRLDAHLTTALAFINSKAIDMFGPRPQSDLQLLAEDDTESEDPSEYEYDEDVDRMYGLDRIDFGDDDERISTDSDLSTDLTGTETESEAESDGAGDERTQARRRRRRKKARAKKSSASLEPRVRPTVLPPERAKKKRTTKVRRRAAPEADPSPPPPPPPTLNVEVKSPVKRSSPRKKNKKKRKSMKSEVLPVAAPPPISSEEEAPPPPPKKLTEVERAAMLEAQRIAHAEALRENLRLLELKAKQAAEAAKAAAVDAGFDPTHNKVDEAQMIAIRKQFERIKAAMPSTKPPDEAQLLSAVVAASAAAGESADSAHVAAVLARLAADAKKTSAGLFRPNFRTNEPSDEDEGGEGDEAGSTNPRRTRRNRGKDGASTRPITPEETAPGDVSELQTAQVSHANGVAVPGVTAPASTDEVISVTLETDLHALLLGDDSVGPRADAAPKADAQADTAPKADTHVGTDPNADSHPRPKAVRLETAAHHTLAQVLADAFAHTGVSVGAECGELAALVRPESDSAVDGSHAADGANDVKTRPRKQLRFDESTNYTALFHTMDQQQNGREVLVKLMIESGSHTTASVLSLLTHADGGDMGRRAAVKLVKKVRRAIMDSLAQKDRRQSDRRQSNRRRSDRRRTRKTDVAAVTGISAIDAMIEMAVQKSKASHSEGGDKEGAPSHAQWVGVIRHVMKHSVTGAVSVLAHLSRSGISVKPICEEVGIDYRLVTGVRTAHRVSETKFGQRTQQRQQRRLQRRQRQHEHYRKREIGEACSETGSDPDSSSDDDVLRDFSDSSDADRSDEDASRKAPKRRKPILKHRRVSSQTVNEFVEAKAKKDLQLHAAATNDADEVKKRKSRKRQPMQIKVEDGKVTVVPVMPPSEPTLAVTPPVTVPVTVPVTISVETPPSPSSPLVYAAVSSDEDDMEHAETNASTKKTQPLLASDSTPASAPVSDELSTHSSQPTSANSTEGSQDSTPPTHTEQAAHTERNARATALQGEDQGSSSPVPTVPANEPVAGSTQGIDAMPTTSIDDLAVNHHGVSRRSSQPDGAAAAEAAFIDVSADDAAVTRKSSTTEDRSTRLSPARSRSNTNEPGAPSSNQQAVSNPALAADASAPLSSPSAPSTSDASSAVTLHSQDPHLLDSTFVSRSSSMRRRTDPTQLLLMHSRLRLPSSEPASPTGSARYQEQTQQQASPDNSSRQPPRVRPLSAHGFEVARHFHLELAQDPRAVRTSFAPHLARSFQDRLGIMPTPSDITSLQPIGFRRSPSKLFTVERAHRVQMTRVLIDARNGKRSIAFPRPSVYSSDHFFGPTQVSGNNQLPPGAVYDVYSQEGHIGLGFLCDSSYEDDGIIAPERLINNGRVSDRRPRIGDKFYPRTTADASYAATAARTHDIDQEVHISPPAFASTRMMVSRVLKPAGGHKRVLVEVHDIWGLTELRHAPVAQRSQVIDWSRIIEAELLQAEANEERQNHPPNQLQRAIDSAAMEPDDANEEEDQTFLTSTGVTPHLITSRKDDAVDSAHDRLDGESSPAASSLQFNDLLQRPPLPGFKVLSRDHGLALSASTPALPAHTQLDLDRRTVETEIIFRQRMRAEAKYIRATPAATTTNEAPSSTIHTNSRSATRKSKRTGTERNEEPSTLPDWYADGMALGLTPREIAVDPTRQRNTSLPALPVPDERAKHRLRSSLELTDEKENGASWPADHARSAMISTTMTSLGRSGSSHGRRTSSRQLPPLKHHSTASSPTHADEGDHPSHLEWPEESLQRVEAGSNSAAIDGQGAFLTGVDQEETDDLYAQDLLASSSVDAPARPASVVMRPQIVSPARLAPHTPVRAHSGLSGGNFGSPTNKLPQSKVVAHLPSSVAYESAGREQQLASKRAQMRALMDRRLPAVVAPGAARRPPSLRVARSASTPHLPIAAGGSKYLSSATSSYKTVLAPMHIIQQAKSGQTNKEQNAPVGTR